MLKTRTINLLAVVILVFSALTSILIIIYPDQSEETPAPPEPVKESVREELLGLEAGYSPTSEDGEANRYFEGPKFYEEVDGEKKLLLIEGIIKSINTSQVIVSRESVNSILARNEIHEIIRFTYSDDNSLTQENINYEDLRLGQVATFHPEDGVLVVTSE